MYRLPDHVDPRRTHEPLGPHDAVAIAAAENGHDPGFAALELARKRERGTVLLEGRGETDDVVEPGVDLVAARTHERHALVRQRQQPFGGRDRQTEGIVGGTLVEFDNQCRVGQRQRP